MGRSKEHHDDDNYNVNNFDFVFNNVFVFDDLFDGFDFVFNFDYFLYGFNFVFDFDDLFNHQYDVDYHDELIVNHHDGFNPSF
jgi:hypothetical protein